MKRYLPFLSLAGIFIAISAVIYFIHYLIFRDPEHIFLFMVGDLAFLPLEVFLVVVVIERILARRERQALLKKLNMVVGAFFSEVGHQLIRRVLPCFLENPEIRQKLSVSANWSRDDFKKARAFAISLAGKPQCSAIDLEGLRAFLIAKRQFLLGLLENPNLLEYESFTGLLWATFHLAEELEARPSVRDLPHPDVDHIAGDVKRMYGHLLAEWVGYTEHLKASYPFLFSLVVRTNPFNEQASAIVR